MKITLSKASGFVFLIGLLTGIINVCESTDANNTQPYAEVFPSLNDVVSMAYLSRFVYEFKYFDNFTCSEFTPPTTPQIEDISCEWYIHERMLGTQVLSVSNKKEKYIAIIFAGTDDIRTSLEDTNLMKKPFGNKSVQLKNDTDQISQKVKVHAGFNNAVFTHDIWEQIYSRIQDLLQKYPTYRLWTTGHSLGGANSILAASAFASLNDDREVLSVSFGCPQTGNSYWREYFNSTSPLRDNLGIWRIVLSWDLVPRLPHSFYHVGHTVQINDKTKDLTVYYEHYGDQQQGYAGVPVGWYAKSYAWLPYALYYHRMSKYLEYLEGINSTSWDETSFETFLSVHDDDMYENPPDDWFVPDDEIGLVDA